MIKMSEILKNGEKFEDLDEEVQANLLILLEKANKIRAAYGKPLIVSSGYRDKHDHIRIYIEKAMKEGKPFDITKVPMGSKHLTGSAIDLFDPNQELQKWVKENIKLFEDVGLWMEDFSATPNWVHVQIVPPKSGKRFFIP
jgi:hypothetical protein